MRALWPCDELWIARAVPRLERAAERKADGSVVGKLHISSYILHPEAPVTPEAPPRSARAMPMVIRKWLQCGGPRTEGCRWQ